MPPEHKPQTPYLKVGVLVIVALVILAAGIFLIGDRENLFRSKTNYVVRFSAVGGLQAGSPVQLNGVNVGSVDDVVLPKDPSEPQLEIRLSIDDRYSQRVREDSRARIKTLGLLGDKFIEVSSGSPEADPIPPGGEIKTAEGADMQMVLESGEDILNNVLAISRSTVQVLDRMERGEGFLGQLLSDKASKGRNSADSLYSTLESIEQLTEEMRTGSGPLPRLISDQKLADRLAGSVTRLDAILAAAESGDGLAPALLNDAGMRQRLDNTLAQLEEASGRLNSLASSLEEGEGLVPRLLTDEAFADQVTGQLNDILERVDATTMEIAEGDGTVAQLIHDPEIHNALNDILVGINESKLLRWLIRNRQKKGIKVRYQDAQEEAAGQEGADPDAGEPVEEQTVEGAAAAAETR